MLSRFHPARAAVALSLAAAAVAATVAVADDLSWNQSDRRVSADIDAGKLPEILEGIARQTGWEIFLEPETEHKITTRFRNLDPSDALDRLLGDLNYALLPGNGKSLRLLVYRTSPTGATQRIVRRAAAPRVGLLANELIVTLDPDSEVSIDELAEQIGAKVLGKIDGTNAYRLGFPDENAAEAARTQLTSDARVAAIDSNFGLPQPVRPDPLLAASTAGPPVLKAVPPPPGGGTIVGLIDSWVQSGSDPIKDFLLPGLSLFPETNEADLGFTHGTAMAETIVRGASVVSPDGSSSFQILPVDIYGNNENTTTFDVARGINAAVEAGARIINLSLGTDLGAPYLEQMIAHYHDQGIVFVGAAGNDPLPTPVFPAAYPEVVAVTAGTRAGAIADYANYGDFVDVIAPGASVVHWQDQAFLGSGTSYSAAYVSGIAAGLASQSGQPLPQVEQEVRDSLKIDVSSGAP